MLVAFLTVTLYRDSSVVECQTLIDGSCVQFLAGMTGELFFPESVICADFYRVMAGACKRSWSF